VCERDKIYTLYINYVYFGNLCACVCVREREAQRKREDVSDCIQGQYTATCCNMLQLFLAVCNGHI